MYAPKVYAYAGVGMICYSIFFGFLGFPFMINYGIKSQRKLKVGSEVRDLWEFFPWPLSFKVYLWNITNANEVNNGAKPILQEAGPYYYDEFYAKDVLEDRVEDDTIEYSRKNIWYWKSDQNPGKSGDDIVVLPHVLMMAIVNGVLREKPGMISAVAKAFNSILKKPESLFMPMKVKDLLFDGLEIDCTVKDAAAKAVCGLLSAELPEIPGKPGVLAFSIFGQFNNTPNYRQKIRVLRGFKDVNDVGKVVEMNGQKVQTVWEGENAEKCNEFKGTDGTIFKPFFKNHEDLVIFASDMCVSLSAKYEKPSKVSGIKTERYTASLGDQENDPDMACLCEPATETTPRMCARKGTFDVYRCLKLPIVGSLPHFYDADESLLELVEGCHPNKDKHEIAIDLEPFIGLPISLAKRVQMNIEMQPVEKVKVMKNLPKALLPLFWIDEELHLPPEVIKRLKMLFITIKVMSGLKWLTLLGGFASIGGFIYAEFMQELNEPKQEVIKISTQDHKGITDPMQVGEKNEKEWPLNISEIQSAQVPVALDKSS